MRIVIADDHGLYRKGLRSAIEAAMPGLEVKEAASVAEALSLDLAAAPVDLILLDFNMPGVMTWEVAATLRDRFSSTYIVIVSAADSRDNVLEALASGFHGFISKSQSDEEIVGAISDVLSGRIYVPPGVAVSDNGTHTRAVNKAHSANAVADRGQLSRLTGRQQNVLKLIGQGLSNKEIARELGIAEPTAKIHVAALLRALGVRNRTSAAVLLQSSSQAGTELAGEGRSTARECGAITPERHG